MTIEVDDPGVRTAPQPAGVDEGQSMEALALELQATFPSVPIDQVTLLVESLWAHFDSAPVRDFVPLLVRKQAKEELRDHFGPRAEATVPVSRPVRSSELP